MIMQNNFFKATRNIIRAIIQYGSAANSKRGDNFSKIVTMSRCHRAAQQGVIPEIWQYRVDHAVWS